MITEARFVLAVPDLERSAQWYSTCLGFSVHEIGDPGWRFFERDGITLMVGHCAEAIPPKDLGDHSWFAYWVVSDVDAEFDRLVAHGADILSPPTDKPWGMRELHVRTVDGHRITLATALPE